MEKVLVEFSREEVSALVQMMNVAVKQDGLQAARPALHIIDKIDAAVAAQNTPTEDGQGAA